MTTSKGLGLSLEAMGVGALLANKDADQQQSNVLHIPLNRIFPSETLQPRQEMDDESLSSLAESLKAHGVLQPILVRPKGADRYEIIAGERRFRAASKAELASIPCIVKNVANREGLAIAIVENLQREALNPIEAAEALCKLIDQHNYTQASLAQTIGQSRSHVANLLRLLHLHPEVKDFVTLKKIDMGHARALLPLDYEKQAHAARSIIQHRLSVRATENWVKSKKEKPPRSKPITVANLPGVSVHFQKKGGYVKLPFCSEQELSQLLDHLLTVVSAKQDDHEGHAEPEQH